MRLEISQPTDNLAEVDSLMEKAHGGAPEFF
jgi:hypothetical protein